MRVKILTILLIALLPFQLYSQIEDEIRAYVDTSESMVQQGRLLMLKELNQNNLGKTREIYDYLTALTKDGPYAAFYYNEELYINMLTNDWETVDKLMMDYDYRNDLVYQSSRDLAVKTQAMVSINSQSLTESCEKSSIDEQPKMLIRALLTYLDSDEHDDKYNALISAYKKKYQNQKYESFEKKFMPVKNIIAAWSFSLGSGMVFPTGDLGLDFPENVAINFGMDVNVNKVYASLYIQGSSLKLQRPFYVYSGSDTMKFAFDEKFAYFEGGLKGGYFLIRNNTFQLAPYVSILGSSLKSTKYSDPEDDDLEYEIFNSFAYGAGLHSEIKLYEFKKKIPSYGNPDTYLSFKLDAGYNKIAKFKDKTSIGDIPYFMAALVFGLGKF
ncbi:MAG TPA: hypothetical protein VK212_08160 [Lentimicrobium sp.]|nr:hypothetical protein [Lentimicrobium sp.]